jgi:hypothetical protein
MIFKIFKFKKFIQEIIIQKSARKNWSKLRIEIQNKTMQKHNTFSRDFISFQNIALHFVRKLS